MNELLKSTLEGLKGIADVNTIVGQAVETQNGTVIIPVSKLSMGFVAGGSDFPNSKADDGKNHAGGGGGGVTIDPVAFLIVSNDGDVRLMDMEGGTANILGSIPGLIDQLVKKLPDKKKKDISDILNELDKI
ncbi:MAG: sporulation protein YtfJ [Oscillospiraceae bacterium]|nr:sporulation protein YtfJ [Oscillospiraceae bacterium]